LVADAVREVVSYVRTRWQADLPTARDNMQWQMLRILLIFRMLHLGQLIITITVPAVVLGADRPGVSLAASLLMVGESVWFVARLLRLKAYGPVSTAYVEIGCAVLLLVSNAVLLPPGDRSEWAAPLLIITTEQITGVAVASALGFPRYRLTAATLAVAAAYTTLIAVGNLAVLSHADVLIGITSYFALALLIRTGSVFLLATPDRIVSLTAEVAAKRQRDALEMELHNHIDKVLYDLGRFDPSFPGELESLRLEAAEARARLRSFFDLGVFDSPTTIHGMLQRQIGSAEINGLHVFLVSMISSTDATATLDAEQTTMLEPALRAVLLNVCRHAGVREAMLRTTIATEWGTDRRVLSITVVDHGRGFDPAQLNKAPTRRSSLAGHRDALRNVGGDLAITSEPGHTSATITVPFNSDCRREEWEPA
jgi:hypothetical protein